MAFHEIGLSGERNDDRIASTCVRPAHARALALACERGRRPEKPLERDIRESAADSAMLACVNAAHRPLESDPLENRGTPRRFRLRHPLAVLLFAAWPASQAAAQNTRTTQCAADGAAAFLSNAALTLRFAVGDGHLRPARLENRLSGSGMALQGELFELKRRDGTRLRASEFRLNAPLRCVHAPGRPEAVRKGARRSTESLEGTFVRDDGELSIAWRASIGDEGAYVRETFVLTASKDVDIKSLSLISLRLPGASIAGTADGTPILSVDAFFAFEHPMARALVIDAAATSSLRRALPLRAGIPVAYSAVIGVAAPGQLRRSFAAYLEAERAHPFRTFLHYNSWYDIGYFSRYTEADALGAIERIGKALVVDRHVVVDSFLFDDGWDDTAHLWEFNDGFPQGFARIRAAAARFGAAPGMWLSPWGGYGAPREARLAAAKAAGFEADTQGLALSGPKYYARFHAATVALLQSYGINQFKLDGTGSADKVTPGSTFDSDFSAAMALIEDLREMRPDLFINLTTGTWPSPFWLLSADSIWRGGEDHEFAGRGTDRQRWITYRDADTYGGIVRESPYYPLNSLMLHGIIFARHAQGLNADPNGDLPDEVWSYFASGTGLQELYVSPDLLTARDWDLIARAARWARERAPVLADSHWQGGDPARDQVYGWAAWSPQRAIVALRNPSSRPQSYALDLAAALELPAGAVRRFGAKAAYGRRPPAVLDANRVLVLRLAPHSVLVWDLTARHGIGAAQPRIGALQRGIGATQPPISVAQRADSRIGSP